MFASPMFSAGIEQNSCTQYICFYKSKRVKNTPINMTFSRQVNHCIKMKLIEQLIHSCFISDVHFLKCIVRLMLYIFQILEVTCIGQCISIYNFIIRILIYKQADNMAANKACSTCYQYRFMKCVHYKLQYFNLEILFR